MKTTLPEHSETIQAGGLIDREVLRPSEDDLHHKRWEILVDFRQVLATLSSASPSNSAPQNLLPVWRRNTRLKNGNGYWTRKIFFRATQMSFTFSSARHSPKVQKMWNPELPSRFARLNERRPSLQRISKVSGGSV